MSMFPRFLQRHLYQWYAQAVGIVRCSEAQDIKASEHIEMNGRCWNWILGGPWRQKQYWAALIGFYVAS